MQVPHSLQGVLSTEQRRLRPSCITPAVAAHTVPVDGMKAAAVAAESTVRTAVAAANVDTAAVVVAEAWVRARGCAEDTVHSEHSEPAETAVHAVQAVPWLLAPSLSSSAGAWQSYGCTCPAQKQ